MQIAKADAGDLLQLAEGAFARERDPWANAANAAALVFESELPKTMIGLNLTHQAGATREVLERVQALPGAPARAVADWMVFFGSRYERVFGRFAPPVHDPCTVALLIDPEVMTLTAGRSGTAT